MQPCCLERPQLRKALGNRLTQSTTIGFLPSPHALPMITFFQVNIRVTGEHFLTILGPRTRLEENFYFLIQIIIRSDPTVYTIRVFSRSTRTLISEVTDLKDKPEYLVFRWGG